MPSVAAEPVREAGVVYTKPWMVELILDLAGYTENRRLWEMVALEPSAGDGAFLRAMVRRLVASCRRHRVDLEESADAIRAYEIDAEAAAAAVEVMRSQLIELGVGGAVSGRLAKGWIKATDFLEASLGFPVADFVIGNPPYIRMEEIPAAKAQLYRGSFDAMRGRADIYVAFYQAALMQLKPGGVCAYICADRWLLNDYGSTLRRYITTEGFNVQYVVEAYDVPAFESEVSAYPAVTVISRAPQGAVVVAKVLPGIESSDREHVVRLISHGTSNAVVRAARFERWFHGEEPWPCSSPDRLRALKSLEATCAPLENPDTGTRIGIGVATGADDVYVIERNDDIERDRLLPLAMAYDLREGRVEWSGHYLANPWDENGLIDLAQFPRLAAYLGRHGDLLRARNTAKKSPSDRWHKTIDRVNLALTSQHKLYIADIKDRLSPALDEGRTYPHHNLYWITSEKWDLRALGGVLMSDVGEFFIHCYGVRMRGGYLRFQAQYLRRIRVPDPCTLTPKIKADLRRAFDAQDRRLATHAALEAYQLDALPD